MDSMFEPPNRTVAPLVWDVGALCRAIADALQARFNPVVVRGEISGFSRAASGHCYFNLKDAQGQIRCAMFRRAAHLLDFSPRDGELVERVDEVLFDALGETLERLVDDGSWRRIRVHCLSGRKSVRH